MESFACVKKKKRLAFAVHGVRGCPGTVVVARRFVVRGRSFVVVVVVESSSAKLVRRRREPGGATGRALFRAFGAAEEARAARIRGADGTQGKSFFFSIISLHLGFGVCVCREASSSQVELV